MTRARAIAGDAAESTYFDLEAAVDRRRLDTPEQTLGRLSGLVVIDEVQRFPALFETVRVLVDRPENGARYLLLGSASPPATSFAKRVTSFTTLRGVKNWPSACPRMVAERNASNILPFRSSVPGDRLRVRAKITS